MYSPSRDEARHFLVLAWQKFKAGQPLSGLEGMVAEIVSLHPEYQPLLEQPERHVERDWIPESGESNPFLHLALHLAVAEQLSVDQPPGIAVEFQRLRASKGDAHAAMHAVIECLGEVLWQAQRTQSAPDGALYVDCLQKRR